MKREALEAREFGLIIASSNFPFYAAPEADAVMDAMERRIARLSKCVEMWKKVNEDLQRTNTRLRKAISLNSLKEIEYMSTENADLKNRIKELEHKLYGSSGQSTRLLNRINNFRSTDPKATDLIEDCYKCIHQQMATISKMETTNPKWISVKDRKPPEGQHVLVVRNHRLRSLYPIDVVCWSECYITHDIVTHWMPLPSAPTTEKM